MRSSLLAGSWWKSTRCFTLASWHNSTPTTLLEWPQSSFTDTASASEYIAPKITKSASAKKAAAPSTELEHRLEPTGPCDGPAAFFADGDLLLFSAPLSLLVAGAVKV